MKIETSLLNAVRFPADSNTKLHFHTGNVDAESPTVVDSAVGDKLFLRSKNPSVPLPLIDSATPYGAGADEFTGFRFSIGFDENYATTAASEPPEKPEFISDLVDRFRMSLFVKPEVATTGGARVLVAGVPGMFGVYQQDSYLNMITSVM